MSIITYRKDRVSDVPEVDERLLAAVTQLGMPGAGGCVLHHGDLETLLE